MQLWKVVAVAAFIAAASSSNGAEASPALRRRQAAGTLYQDFAAVGRFDETPLASEQVYKLLPDACKPLLASYTGIYATQEELGKCLALVKKSSFGQDAYLYVKNHTDLIATLPWQESIFKASYNNTLAKLKEVVDQADSLPANNWRKFLYNMDQALYPAAIPMQVKLRLNTQMFGGYLMLQPFALAARPGKGEVFAAALTQTLLSKSNLNGNEAIKFFNSKSPSADVERYVGWVVDSINGKNPYDIAQTILDNLPPFPNHYAFVSSYLQYESPFFEYNPRDNGTFSYTPGVLSLSYNGYTDGSFFQNPVAYVLRNPATNATVTHTFPWLFWPNCGYEWRVGEALLSVLNIPVPSDTKKGLVSTSSTRTSATSSTALPTATGLPVTLTSIASATATLTSPVATLVPSNAAVENGTATGSQRVARRQINSVSDPEAFAKVSTSLSYLLPPAAARIGPNVYQVDQQTLAVTFFHPKTSYNDYLTYDYSSKSRRESLDKFLAYFDRMDAALEAAVKSNPNIKNVILDLTQWAMDNEMLALASYFFGSTVKPLEYAFRLTPLVEAILKGFAASEDSDGYQYDGMFPFFNTSQHAPPTANVSSPTFDINNKLTVPTTNILSQAKNITVNGSPVRVSGRFVPANLFAATAVLKPVMQRLPKLAAAAGKSNGAYFDPSSLTILTVAEACSGKCEEFVRIARTQFKIRTVTLGLDVNGVVSAPTSPASVPLSYLYERDFFSTFVTDQLALLKNPLAPTSTLTTDPKLASVVSAAKEVASLLPNGFSTERFGFGAETPYRMQLSIPTVLVYDAGAADDAIPLGLANATEADVTLKDVWAFDWPMGVWKVAVNTPAQNVATQRPGGGNAKSPAGMVRASVWTLVAVAGWAVCLMA
ncbi:hypothetical protein HDU96_005568 [Phlyctochytrium bullatum]|nr:hypothetical protein HDU96_005568 [Phlyctochytrium bullatum]